MRNQINSLSSPVINGNGLDTRVLVDSTHVCSFDDDDHRSPAFSQAVVIVLDANMTRKSKGRSGRTREENERDTKGEAMMTKREGREKRREESNIFFGLDRDDKGAI
jgi:hypothetical protein